MMAERRRFPRLRARVVMSDSESKKTYSLDELTEGPSQLHCSLALAFGFHLLQLLRPDLRLLTVFLRG